MADEGPDQGVPEEFSFDDMEPIIEVAPRLTRKELKEQRRRRRVEAMVRRRLERIGISTEELGELKIQDHPLEVEVVDVPDTGVPWTAREEVPIPRDLKEDRGALVAEVNRDVLQARLVVLRREARTSRWLLALLAISTVLALVLGGGWRDEWMMLNIIVLVLLLVSEASCGMPLLRTVAASVHENGIEVVTQSGRSMFLPWGVLARWMDCYLRFSFWPRVDDKGRLRWDVGPVAGGHDLPAIDTSGHRQVVIPREMGDPEAIKTLLDERGGDLGYITMEFADSLRRNLGRTSIYSVIASVVAGFGLGAALIGMELIPSGLTAAGLLFASAPLVIIATAVAAHFVPDLTSMYNFRVRPNLAPFGAVVLIMVLLVPFAAALSWHGTWMPDSETSATSDPGESAVAMGVHEDRTLFPTGPVVVHDGEALTLINCTLRFRPDPWGRYGIWVGPGGSLELINTTVECEKFYVGYTFEVHGDALVEGCLIRQTARGIGGGVVDGGLEVHDGNITVRDTVFQECQGPALLVIDSRAEVHNCTFRNVLGRCIGVYHGTANISSCRFERSNAGTVAEDSTVRIEDCAFKELGKGVSIYWSNVTLDECSFETISLVGVDVYGSDIPDLATCEFRRTVTESKVSWNTVWEPTCLVATVVVGVSSVYALLSLRRSWIEWEMGNLVTGNRPPQPFSTTSPIPGSPR